MKEVIIHMGFHKTASSSIQATCTENRKLLKKKGIFYPIFTYNEKKIINHSIPIYSLLSASPQNFHVNIKWGVDAELVNREYLQQLDHITRTEDKIIISGEGISSLPENSLHTLLDYFKTRDFIIKAVAFVRSPVSSKISAAQERVKNGGMIMYSDNQFPSDRIKKLQSVFSSAVEFYPFKTVCSHQYGPTGFFLELAGLNKKLIKKINYLQVNESLSDQATRLIAHINKVEPFYILNDTTGQKAINPNRNTGDTVVFQKISGNKYKPTLSEIQHILEKAKQENNWLKQHLGDQFCDDEMELEFNETRSPWTDNHIQQLREALDNCSPVLRKIVIDFIENEIDSGRVDNIALRQDFTATNNTL